MTFESLGLPQDLLNVLAEEAYTEPTPIQAAAIPALISGRDLLGSAQTGTGKTAAFSLPLIVRLAHANLQPAQARQTSTPDQQNQSPAQEALHHSTQSVNGSAKSERHEKKQRWLRANQKEKTRPVRALILAPTRELAIQIQDSLRTYGRKSGLRQTVIVGGVNQIHQERALRHGADIVVATPGRLVDLMQQRLIDLSRIEIFVLDEADRMFDLGFLPDMKRIVSALPINRQNAMFSATMPGPLEELANSILRDPVRVSIEPVAETTDLIEQRLCYVAKNEKTKLLLQMIPNDARTRCIVFVRTKHGADRVAEQLCRQGVTAEALHGNKSQNARVRILASFKSPTPPVLVSTDLAARGIDVDAVTHVFNYDLPHEPETYVHRIGRTGRAGAQGLAIAFCGPDDVKQLAAIERLLGQSIPLDREHSQARPAAAPQEKRGTGAKPSRKKKYPYGKFRFVSDEAPRKKRTTGRRY